MVLPGISAVIVLLSDEYNGSTKVLEEWNHRFIDGF